jgi:alanyl-tRNA synthetase
MTERLYYTNAYLVDFDARILERADGGRRIFLDRSAFYPTSGGQSHDLGSLGGVSVESVEDDEDRIAHILSAALPESAVDVTGHIDWTRRFDHMQQHTGQHLVSAVIAEMLSRATLSVHFGAVSSSLDIETDALSSDHLRAAEQRANEIVTENRSVSVSFESASEAASLRKEPKRSGTLRVVTIQDLDRSACGGTHVRATGEIGPILLRKTEKIRAATRIEFVCGMRAVRRAHTDFDALSSIAQGLSGSIDDAASLVESQTRDLREAESYRKRADALLAVYRAREMWDAAVPDVAGVRHMVQRVAGGSVDDVRALALACASLPRTVFVALSEMPPSVLVAASDDSGFDAGRTLKAALAAAGGRGGGSPRLAQGSVPSAAALAAIPAALGVPVPTS